jgi:hypothetical protein
MRESFEDSQALGRDLIARGLGGAPMLIVADGAPGLIKAIEHRLRLQLVRSGRVFSAR